VKHLFAMVAVACGACGGSTHGLDRSVGLGGTPLKAHEVSVTEIQAKGFQCEVETRHHHYYGELLAVDRANVYVLPKGHGYRPAITVPVQLVEHVTVKLDDETTRTAGLGAWTFLGTLSTASHGYFLVFSAPAWLITGISTTAVSAKGTTNVPANAGEIPALWQFARFPQGWPRGWPVPPSVVQ
jgi:hypothetical protein